MPSLRMRAHLISPANAVREASNVGYGDCILVRASPSYNLGCDPSVALPIGSLTEVFLSKGDFCGSRFCAGLAVPISQNLPACAGRKLSFDLSSDKAK